MVEEVKGKVRQIRFVESRTGTNLVSEKKIVKPKLLYEALLSGYVSEHYDATSNRKDNISNLDVVINCLTVNIRNIINELNSTNA